MCSVLSILTVLCSQHHICLENPSFCNTEAPSPLATTSPSASPRQPPFCFVSLWMSLLYGPHLSGCTEPLSLWLASRSRDSPGFVHVVVWHYFQIKEDTAYRARVTYPFTCRGALGPWAFFHRLAAVTVTAVNMNVGVQTPPQGPFLPFGSVPRNRIAEWWLVFKVSPFFYRSRQVTKTTLFTPF